MEIQQPLTSGKFALYQTPNGGMHLTLLVEGESEPRHVEIPKMMVKMMMRKGNSGGFDPSNFTSPLSLVDPSESGE